MAEIDDILASLNARGVLSQPLTTARAAPSTTIGSTPAPAPAPAPITTTQTTTQTRDFNTVGGGTISQFDAAAATPHVPAEYALLKQLLAEFGLESIYNDVAKFITSESTAPEIELALREIPAYQERFKVIFEREKQGLPPVSAAEVVDYERQLGQVMSFYGVPSDPGENLQETAAELLLGDVSMSEVQQRLTAQAAFGRAVLDDPNQDQEVVRAILGNGGTLFDVANFALDPNKTLEQIERRLAAAEIANEASQAQYRINAPEALELARQGVTGEQAQQQFGVLNQNRQVIDRMIGDRSDPISREQELAAVAGDVNAQAAIERARQSRIAQFSVGGGFATDDDGFTI